MKTRLIASLLILGLFACNNSNKNESSDSREQVANEDTVTSVSYAIDTTSFVNWKGSMIGVYAHEGTIGFKEGSLTITGGIVSEGAFIVDMSSMVTTDDDALYEMAPREKLIGHLQSDDFFSVETFPTASFTVKSATEGSITGDLTIKGVTNEETVTNVSIDEDGGKLSASGNLTFDRQIYGISYKNTMGDMVLADEIELRIELLATKK
ncbi:YceI family protein [Ekhidna sp.]|uniref:YceI family protein n=1 Tax=Ekhidna sp. TaxID=2608089 RepID=UPI0032EFAAB5